MPSLIRLHTIDDVKSLQLLVGNTRDLSISQERMLQRSILSYRQLIQPTSNIRKLKMTCFKRFRSKTTHRGLRKNYFISSVNDQNFS